MPGTETDKVIAANLWHKQIKNGDRWFWSNDTCTFLDDEKIEEHQPETVFYHKRLR